MNLTITTRKRLIDFYCIEQKDSVPMIQPKGEGHDLNTAGIYMLFDRRLSDVDSDNELADLIYIGLAGAVGAKSTFDDRIPKHIKKALGFHEAHSEFPQSGISDTERWKQYREKYLNDSTQENLKRLQENWDLQLIKISNRSPDERKFIALMEKLIGLIYAVSHLPDISALNQPPCNGSSLVKSLVKAFNAMSTTSDVDREVSENVGEIEQGENVIRTLTADNDYLDDEFFDQLSESAQRIYIDLVTASQELFSTPDLSQFGLYWHYTDTNGRDMRLGGSFRENPLRLNCLRIAWRPALSSFDVFSRVNASEINNMALKRGVSAEVTETNDNLYNRTRLWIGQGEVRDFLLELLQRSCWL